MNKSDLHKVGVSIWINGIGWSDYTLNDTKLKFKDDEPLNHYKYGSSVSDIIDYVKIKVCEDLDQLKEINISRNEGYTWKEPPVEGCKNMPQKHNIFGIPELIGSEKEEFDSKIDMMVKKHPYLDYKRVYESELEIYYMDKANKVCDHKNTDYQPEEKDTNTQESLSCEDCGKDLPLPEPSNN